MSLTGNQKAFAQYLADLWGKPEALGEMCDLFPVGDASEVGLLHSFRISKHQSWKPWKGRIASVVHHWWCHSLQEAFLHYSWPDSPKPNSFQCIAARLRQALAVHDQETARYACLAIFRWGGVRGRKSLAWVEDQYQQNSMPIDHTGSPTASAWICTGACCIRWQETPDEFRYDKGLRGCRP